MSSADENELIQGLVDMAEAYWDERTALRARVAELEMVIDNARALIPHWRLREVTFRELFLADSVADVLETVSLELEAVIGSKETP